MKSKKDNYHFDIWLKMSPAEVLKIRVREGKTDYRSLFMFFMKEVKPVALKELSFSSIVFHERKRKAYPSKVYFSPNGFKVDLP